MKLVKGTELSEQAKQEVLSAYVYRPTFENPRAVRLGGAIMDDATWLGLYCFHITKAGHLAKNCKWAVPAFIVEG